jgi:hypothetical protein
LTPRKAAGLSNGPAVSPSRRKGLFAMTDEVHAAVKGRMKHGSKTARIPEFKQK